MSREKTVPLWLLTFSKPLPVLRKQPGFLVLYLAVSFFNLVVGVAVTRE
jgi:hypothetical protein